jgi:hypothetical protein
VSGLEQQKMNSTLLLSGWGRKLGKQLMKPIQKKKPDIQLTKRWNIVIGDLVWLATDSLKNFTNYR